MCKCNKFGDKDIVTDKITYRYADSCRVDKNLCGKEGKYFEEDPFIQWKVLGHRALHLLPYVMIYGILLRSICAQALVNVWTYALMPLLRVDITPYFQTLICE